MLPIEMAIDPNRNGGSRLKVVHAVVAGDVGGAERLLCDLASRPEHSGADHCVALMTPNPRLRDTFRAAGLSIRDRGPAVRENPLAYLRRSFGPSDVAWLAGVLAEERASLVHLHTLGAHVLGVRAAQRVQIPVVRTEHGIRHFRDPSCALFRHWALRSANRVIAVSEYVARGVATVAPYAQPKLCVIRNGVDAAYFAPRRPPAGGPFRLCVVSRLEPWKRVDLVIRALSRVPEVRLCIAGDGSAGHELRALASRLCLDNRVSFLGYQPDPRPVIADSDAAVNCSGDEPLGLSVLEALAMQRPVIAFDGGGIPEIVQDGRTGWLFREHSVDALAACIAEASASRGRAAAFGVNARAFIEENCRIEDMCVGYGRVYADLVGGRYREPLTRPALSGMEWET
jgi:glycosyltransferase involved in cell wall biosynthesis